VKPSVDPLKDDPVAAIDSSCVACGNCGEVADAAVLCPSFYRADVVHNPGAWDRFKASVRNRVIAWLQRRREHRRPSFTVSSAS
jgi:indolepyruvate ferredoxin oxidoreductase alpha subunit